MGADPVPSGEAGEAGEVKILLDRKTASVKMVPGETLLEAARRAGMGPPFSCEAGNCGTCMAKLVEGRATMRVNDALDEDEVEVVAELLGALTVAIRSELTPHQREVLIALAVDGVPIDVLADRLGSTRGALYKALHDARRKLRATLSAQGLGPDDVPQEASR